MQKRERTSHLEQKHRSRYVSCSTAALTDGHVAPSCSCRYFIRTGPSHHGCAETIIVWHIWLDRAHRGAYSVQYAQWSEHEHIMANETLALGIKGRRGVDIIASGILNDTKSWYLRWVEERHEKGTWGQHRRDTPGTHMHTLIRGPSTSANFSRQRT